MGSKEYNNIYIAKGIGILLVVIGHFEGVSQYTPDWYLSARQFIYTFHMPMFMALSGFLFGKLFGTKLNYKSFVKKKFKRLLIPYFTLSLILFGVKYFAGFFFELKHAVLLNDALYQIFVQPNIGFASFLWFMYTLFLIFCIVPLFKNITYLLIFSLIIYFIPFTPYFCINLVAKYLLFFCLGVLIYNYSDILNSINKKLPYILIVLCSVVLILLFLIYNKQDTTLITNFMELSMGCAGTIALFNLSTIMSDAGKGKKLFSKIGRHCSEIYLLHTIAMGMFTATLVYLPINEVCKFYLAFVLAVLGGIYIPILLSKYIISRYDITNKFILGNFK